MYRKLLGLSAAETVIGGVLGTILGTAAWWITRKPLVAKTKRIQEFTEELRLSSEAIREARRVREFEAQAACSAEEKLKQQEG
ncbi:hypothetical protein CCACVL1_21286 [Corchorus capsularis]|uniref:Uncharacterized protein n=1 Tax=Corchorus capsularis TaxID=210143 RepID=A0A1R3H7E0_COCAP|nr:hypothetical protein CCACVL1_21286 [Corchorus capsularis]